MIIQHRRGKIADWKKADELVTNITLEEAQEKNLIPRDGELFIIEEENGSYVYKIGDGKTKSVDLPYIDARAESKLADRLAAVKATISNKIADLEAAQEILIRNSQEQFSQQIKDKETELVKAFQEADQKTVADIKQFVNNSIIDLQQDLDTFKTDTDSAIDDVVTQVCQVENNLSADIKDAKAALTEKSKNLTSEVDNLKIKITEISRELTENLDTFIDETFQQFKAQGQSIDDLLTDKEKLEAQFNNVCQQFKDTNAVVNNLLIKHTNEFSSITQEIKNLASELEVAVDKTYVLTLKDLELKASELKAYIDNQISDTSKSLTTLVTDTEVKQTEALQEAKSFLTNYIKDSQSTQKKIIEDLTRDFQAKDVKLLADLNSIQKQYELDKTDITGKLSLLESQLNNSNTSWLDKWNSIKNTIEGLSNDLSDKITNIDKQCQDKLEVLEDNFTELAQNQLTAEAELQAALLNYITSIYTELADLVEDDILILEKAYAVENNLDVQLKKAIADFDKKLLDQNKTSSASLENSKQELLSKVTEVENSLSTEISEVAVTSEENLTKAIEAIMAEISLLANRLASNTIVLTNTVAQLRQDLTTELNTTKSTAQENLKAAERTITENIETLRSTSNLKIEANKRDIAAVNETIQKNTEALSDRISAARAALQVNQKDTAEVLGVLNEKIEDNKQQIIATNTKMDNQNKRINKLIALPTSENTEGNIELIDVRNGYNGIYHESAGDAVRSLGNELASLKDSLKDYTPENAIDGLEYEDNILYLTTKGQRLDATGVEIVGGSGGTGGGSLSKVTIKNNLTSATFTAAKGRPVNINFTYSSLENEVPTGDGTYVVYIDNKKIEALSGVVQHNIPKILDITAYLKNGSNTVKVTCSDVYGATRSLTYHISLIEFVLKSSFISDKTFNDSITFRYTPNGRIEKTVHILVDGKEVLTKTFSPSVSGSESTFVIPTQAYGCHTILAYMTAQLDGEDLISNELRYEILCTKTNRPNEAHALLASVLEETNITQGNLLRIPYQVYDPNSEASRVDVNLTVYSKQGGNLTEVYQTTANTEVGKLTEWLISQYPAGLVVFEISYTYTVLGETYTIKKPHELIVAEVQVDVEAVTDSLQLYLHSKNRANTDIANREVWTFKPADGDEITTSFSHFNWKSNGWITEGISQNSTGDTCLRLSGDARAIINFTPFKEDFKDLGKTIEFEFAIRDVNSRDTSVINCFDGERGFCVTPDTAFLQSSGTYVSCRFKDEERVRVTITVEHKASGSCFVAMYLDGILSGIQKYEPDDDFSQSSALPITLGSNFCNLDIYSIRIYNRALDASQVLSNFIADKANPVTRRDLMTENNILYTVDDKPTDGDEFVGKISYEKVKALGKIPIITFTGKMPTYKGDKKNKSVYMKFEDPINSNLALCQRAEDNNGKGILLDQIDVQGTSSAGYVRKNWKIKLPEAYEHIPGAIPAKVFCIKVDYAEATGTHNTGTANFVETLYDKRAVRDTATNKITEFIGEGWLPPQKDDERARTTIQGFPVIIFEKETEDSVPVFSSKGNFNYDKGSENVFGFTEDYDKFGVECWEFCNNISKAVNFLDQLPAGWEEDFEPRYVPESANFEAIEKLLEARTNAEINNGIFTDAQKEELANYQANCIKNFKEMHDWVVSTATFTLDSDGQRVDIVPENDAAAEILENKEDFLLQSPVSYAETVYTYDTKEYRLAKFANEFKDHFNVYYATMYYVFTLFALMVDQRAKNMFLTRWKDDDGKYRWYPYFYDNDTIFGINNVGALKFDYFHEDIDQLGSADVYNGQNSTLWYNFRLCFATEIARLYSTLRSEDLLTYDKLIDQYITKGSDKWCAAIYNADAEYKYVSMARDPEAKDYDTNNLKQVRGPGESHLRYFIANRLNYCDSKWFAGNYPSDQIVIRLYTPKTTDTTGMTPEQAEITEAANARILESLSVVPASSQITITPFSNMYAGISYASGTRQQKRLNKGESYTFSAPEGVNTNDAETSIYGASMLSSLGDLSNLYCDYLDLSRAIKLTTLKIGHADPAYHNDNITSVKLGTNRLLKTLDIRNCSGLGLGKSESMQSLNVSGCSNIETILAEGTNLASITLPESGYIKTLHLPATINNLVIKNQPYLKMRTTGDEGFDIESYENLRTLRIEDCENLNTENILRACGDEEGHFTVERVYLRGIKWAFDDTSFIKSLIPRFDNDGNLISGILGIPETSTSDRNIPAHLEGICHFKKISGADYALIKQNFKSLTIMFDEMTSVVRFRYKDTNNTAYEDTISINSKDSKPAECQIPKLTATPAQEENQAFTYTFLGDLEGMNYTGWTTIAPDPDHDPLTDTTTDYLRYTDALEGGTSLKNILGDRILYPVFKANRKSYTITFKNLTNKNKPIVAEVKTPYGSIPEYPGNPKLDIKREDVTSKDLFTFTTWDPALVPTTGEAEYYAQFALKGTAWHEVDKKDIGNNYKLFSDGADSYMHIYKYDNKHNTVIKIPETFDYGLLGSYKVTSVGGFNNHPFELVIFPENLKEIQDAAFMECSYLFEATLPSGLESIGQSAFENCYALRAAKIPAGVIHIGEAAFGNCLSLSDLTVESGNLKYSMINGCLVDTEEGKLLRGISTATIPVDGTVRSLGKHCFSNTKIVAATLFDGITDIPEYAFSKCGALVDVQLPANLKVLGATSFAWCNKLCNIDLPEGLHTIWTWVFNSCAFTTVELPSTLKYVHAGSFGNIPNLQNVVFKMPEDGKIPAVDRETFSGSGSVTNGITFYIPWQMTDKDVNGNIFGDICSTSRGWGAKAYTIKTYDPNTYEGGIPNANV